MSETPRENVEIMDLSKRIFGRKHAMTVMLGLVELAFESDGLEDMNTSDLQDHMQQTHGVNRATTHEELGRMVELGMLISTRRYREVTHELLPSPGWDFIGEVCKLKLTPPTTA